MAKHRRPPADDPPTGEEVVGDAAYWSVDDCRWPVVRPHLPDDMVDLLAPPIVVGVARVPITSRATPPGTGPARLPRPVGPARRPASDLSGRHRRAKGQAEQG
ncbi:hypothetical protein [Micromonospora halophytica]|uniref:Uncharacterized protein n=1 Tax=Micromonospora halophytica TaxID=47864 RepID=A0A1C5J4E9_9ACTN|nr:hypothetical protein [Micromonospora halophytica]SCG65448.1 hypothetical protein GA0070560_12182 [Micromonospora halophytica]